MQKESDSSPETESKRAEISNVPLSRRPSAGFKMVLVAPEPNCLELRPSSLSLFLHGISPLILLLVLVQNSWDWWWIVFAALIMIVEFVRILRAVFASWVRFDRNRDMLTLGRSFLSVNHPLEDVTAVQLLKETMWLGFYQLNLVLADHPGHRVNLYAFWKPNLVSKTGQDIANFLSVPLLDEIQSEKG
jgi:hypothetical protein